MSTDPPITAALRRKLAAEARKEASAAELRRANREARNFHGTDEGTVIRLTPEQRLLPEFAVVAGELDEFTYAPPPQSKRGRYKWSHESGDRGALRPKSKRKPILAWSPDTGRPIIVQGTSPMRASSRRGFVG